MTRLQTEATAYAAHEGHNAGYHKEIVEKAYQEGAIRGRHSLMQKAEKWLKEDLPFYIDHDDGSIDTGAMIEDFKKTIEETDNGTGV